VTIFGVEWDDLGLDHVAAFLADADDESYLWRLRAAAVPTRGRSGRLRVGSRTLAADG
jgi:hypothetical protein